MANPESENKLITIELIYALPHQQDIITISSPENTTILEAIQQSKILDRYPEIDLSENKVGVFSKVCQLTEHLIDGDRIEIYRVVVIDPKEARKQRALKNK